MLPFTPCMQRCGDASCLHIPLNKEKAMEGRTKKSPWHSWKIIFRTIV